jgi:hypothetical protein
MTVKVDMFHTEGDEKVITLEITHNQQTFFITKRIALSDGKTNEQYVADALSASQAEIDAWKADTGPVNMVFDEATGTFV